MAEQCLEGIGESRCTMPGRINKRAVDVPENELHQREADKPVLNRLAVPPKMVLRVLDDLHVIAQNLPSLRESAGEIPRSETELAQKVDRLREREVDALLREIRDLREKVPGL